MNWFEELAKMSVVLIWVVIGVVGLSVTVVAVHFIRPWLNDCRQKRLLYKREKLLSEVFSKIKKGDTVYLNRFGQIEEATCVSVRRDGMRQILVQSENKAGIECLIDSGYGFYWALTRKELKGKK